MDQDLKNRTLQRNDSLWASIDWGGLLAPVAADEALLNSLRSSRINAAVDIVDEVMRVREEQRDKAIAFGETEVSQQRQLADLKLASQRAIAAIRRTADDYVHAARLYDSKVKGIIMAAREYAAAIEQEQLALAASETQLQVAKEENRLREINAKITLETVQKALVEGDIARLKVDVAKSKVRVLQTEYEADHAELEVINTEVNTAMAQAESATLRADVASIMADIITRGLAKVRLDVERAEIQAGFAYIDQRLLDLTALWEIRRQMEDYRTAKELEMQDILEELEATDKAAEDLHTAEAENALTMAQYEKAGNLAEARQEETLRNTWADAKEAQMAAQSQSEEQVISKNAWARKLINEAQQGVYKMSDVWRTSTVIDRETIIGH